MRERLIGAAVVVIAAIILIPWLVSRAHRPHEVVQKLPAPATLSKPGEASYRLSLPASGTPVAHGATSAPARSAPPMPTRSAPQRVAHATPAPDRTTGGHAADAGQQPDGSWSVQAASFSKKSAARKLAQRLRRAGFEVYLAPHPVGSRTFYRVRVGPYPTAKGAHAAAPHVSAITRGKVLVQQQKGSG